jgi:hypothetical protein
LERQADGRVRADRPLFHCVWPHDNGFESAAGCLFWCGKSDCLVTTPPAPTVTALASPPAPPEHARRSGEIAPASRPLYSDEALRLVLGDLGGLL